MALTAFVAVEAVMKRKGNTDNLQAGDDCWFACGNSSGFCEACGEERLCCRKSFENDPEECQGMDPPSEFRHECVSAPQHGPTAEQIYKFGQQWNLVGRSTPQATFAGSELKAALSIFVFSRVDDISRRGHIRNMWQEIARTPSMDVSYKFSVCGGKGNTINSDYESLSQVRLTPTLVADDGVPSEGTSFSDLDEHTRQQLYQELHDHKDVLYLECEEGYGEGALTKKVISSMQHFWVNDKSDYFMKVDDDTFIAWSRYLPKLLDAGHHNVYMGIPIGEGVPCRNKDFRWYEPFQTFRKALFPKGMSGGSGYTIGKNLVDLIIHTGVGEENILYNEDRAVGVWMDTLRKSGVEVDYEGIPGIDGFWAWNWHKPMDNWAYWSGYPYTLHHGLEGETIACMADADKSNEAMRQISMCFKTESGKFYEPLKCAAMNTEGQSVKKNQALLTTPDVETIGK